MPEILTVERLSKSFGKVRAVFDLSFQVERCEILGIIGPNGAGKTTLFNLVAGEIRPDEGAVAFNGKDVTHAPMYKRCREGIARTYQVPRPFLNISVMENVLVGTTYGAGMAHRQAKEKSEEILGQDGPHFEEKGHGIQPVSLGPQAIGTGQGTFDLPEASAG